MRNNVYMWTPSRAEEGDFVRCKNCGKPHKLIEGKVDEVRIGDGILFYRCGTRDYIGSINKTTVFGVELCEE